MVVLLLADCFEVKCSIGIRGRRNLFCVRKVNLKQCDQADDGSTKA